MRRFTTSHGATVKFMYNATKEAMEKDATALAENDIGFSTGAVYRTYDDFANDAERTYIEYFLRDAYEYYGYDFKYYDGQPMTDEQLDELTDNFTTLDRYIRETWRRVYKDIQLTVSTGGKEHDAGGDVIEAAKGNGPGSVAGRPALTHDAQAGAGPGPAGAAAVPLREIP